MKSNIDQPILLHVITSLNDGGAEALLYRICTSSEATEFRHFVVSLRIGGKYEELLQKAGVTVCSLGINSITTFIKGVIVLCHYVKEIKPTAIQSWLYHADFVVSLCKLFSCVKCPIYWGIHNTTLVWGKSSLSSLLLVRILAVLSYFVPDKIVCCAEAVKKVHRALGYDCSKLLVICNGYDTSVYVPSELVREQNRKNLNITNNEFLLGMVARYSPQKDHKTLISSLILLKKNHLNYKCILIGTHIEKIRNLPQFKELSDRLIILSPRQDIVSVYQMLDVHVLSSSYGEAFPNVIAESMSCGIPNVATDLGDVRVLIGNTGKIVQAGSASQLAAAISDMYMKYQSEEWQSIKDKARTRIKDSFSFEKMLSLYLRLWRNNF